MTTNGTTDLEVELMIEEVESFIAPGPMHRGSRSRIAPALVPNNNETVEVDLTVEEAEAVIAPGVIVHE